MKLVICFFRSGIQKSLKCQKTATKLRSDTPRVKSHFFINGEYIGHATNHVDPNFTCSPKNIIRTLFMPVAATHLPPGGGTHLSNKPVRLSAV